MKVEIAVAQLAISGPWIFRKLARKFGLIVILESQVFSHESVDMCEETLHNLCFQSLIRVEWTLSQISSIINHRSTEFPQLVVAQASIFRTFEYNRNLVKVKNLFMSVKPVSDDIYDAILPLFVASIDCFDVYLEQRVDVAEFDVSKF